VRGTPARQKIVALADLAERLRAARAAGRQIVLTNGCFDLLHVGHVRYLEQAAALGDLLVVAVNSDASVRALKGPGRPLVAEQERAEVVAALAAVDLVVLFSDRTAERLVELLRPAVYVKGGDYQIEQLPEAAAASALGAEVRLLPLQPGHSSSELIRAVLSRYAPSASPPADAAAR
jgi:rfaE bifunctional protein nucleotidyltransferase chain/domain